MTPVFCCGFECGQLGSVGQHWTAPTGASISTTTVRSGARSLRINPSAATCAIAPASGSISVWVVRFYVRFTTLPNADTYLFAAGGTKLGGVAFKQSDSKIYVATSTGAGSAPANFSASGVSVTTGVWYLIDARVDTVTNITADCKVDGSALAQLTLASNTGSGGNFGCLQSTTADIFFDDVLISSTSADYPIGAGYVNHFVPTSDGTHNVAGAADFRRGDTTTDITNATTTAFQLVDDVPLDDVTPDADDHIRIVAPPNVTDYVECVYGPAPGISTPTAAPRAVEVIAEFFAAGTLASDEIFKLNDNGTVDTVYDGTGIGGTTTGIYKRKHYATAPTGGAWTVVSGAGNFNNIRFRYGFASDANPDKSLMCTMVEAEFASVVALAPKPLVYLQAVKRAAYW